MKIKIPTGLPLLPARRHWVTMLALWRMVRLARDRGTGDRNH